MLSLSTASSSSPLTIIVLYIRDGFISTPPTGSLNNCTNIETPCQTVEQAMEILSTLEIPSSIPLQIKFKILPQRNGKFIYNQCQVSLNIIGKLQRVNIVTFESEFDNDKIITWYCKTTPKDLIQFSGIIKEIQFNNIQMNDFNDGGGLKLNTLPMILSKISLFQVNISNLVIETSEKDSFNYLMIDSSIIYNSGYLYVYRSEKFTISNSTFFYTNISTGIGNLKMESCNFINFKLNIIPSYSGGITSNSFQLSNINVTNSVWYFIEITDLIFYNFNFYGNNEIYSYFCTDIVLGDTIIHSNLPSYIANRHENSIFLNNYYKKETNVLNNDRKNYFHFHIEGTPTIDLDTVTISDISSFPDKSIFEFISCGQVSIQHVSINHVQSNLIFNIERVNSIYMFDGTFSNNIGNLMTSNSFYTKNDGITNTKYSKTNDVSIKPDMFTMIQVNLINNSAIQSNNLIDNDGIFNIYSKKVRISNSKFSNNNGKRGGSLYIVSQLLEMTSITSVYNQANIGGSFYLNIQQLSLNSIKCENNLAHYYGGCIYFEYPNYIKNNFQDVSIKNNIAKSYGNNIGTFLENIKFNLFINYENSIYGNDDNNIKYLNYTNNESYPMINVYPGQIINNIKLNLWNHVNEPVNFLINNIEMKIPNSYSNLFSIKYVTAQGLNETLSLYTISITKLVELTTITNIPILILIDSHNTINISTNILNCPNEMYLSKPDIYSSEYKCIKSTRYDIIIPLVSLVTIVLFSILLLVIYLIVRVIKNIYRKLKRLNAKELAEQKMESKLIEKSIIFGVKKVKTSENSINYENSIIPIDSDDENTNLLSTKLQKNFSHKSWIISIDDIEIKSRIAEGGNGTVYLAVWKKIKIALKSLKGGELSQDDFENEAALLSGIRHPNILQFYGVILTNQSMDQVSSNSKSYMVVEYLENGSLEKCIHDLKYSTRVLSLSQKIQILLQVSKGMHYLHALKPRPIIHRDLKPANILLDANFNAKICDFGMSKVWGLTNSAATTNIHHNMIFCLWNYMIFPMCKD